MARDADRGWHIPDIGMELYIPKIGAPYIRLETGSQQKLTVTQAVNFLNLYEQRHCNKLLTQLLKHMGA